MLEDIIKRLRGDKRGISNVIVVMLSLILLTVIVANVVLWSYQMNNFDWERMQEKIQIAEARAVKGNRTSFTFVNESPLTVHIVSLWIINSTCHRRYSMNFFMNSGENATIIRKDITLPVEQFLVKIVTERGNMAILYKD